MGDQNAMAYKCSSEDEDHKCVSNFSFPDWMHLWCCKNASAYTDLFLF